MKTDTKNTKVKFLLECTEITEKHSGDVFAFFPNEDYFPYKSDTKTCYAHIGQHSACHIDYANECKEATPEQYADLKAELESIF